MSYESSQISQKSIEGLKRKVQNKEKRRQSEPYVSKHLPPNEFVYISSIIQATFQEDLKLISPYREVKERKQLRSNLVEYYLKLSAHQDIFFNALFYLERFLDKVEGQKSYDKHLPIACLALARKYQKGCSPNLNAWKQKLDFQFRNLIVQNLEDEIILGLQFELQPISRFNFMTDLFLIIDLDQKIRNFCSYLLDLSVYIGFKQVQEYQRLKQFTEAQIGLSVVRLACYFFVPDQLQHLPIIQLGFNPQRIHQCCQAIFNLLMNRKMLELKPIRHRYKKSKYMQAARIEFFRIKKISSEKQGQTADEDQKDIKEKFKNISAEVPIIQDKVEEVKA